MNISDSFFNKIEKKTNVKKSSILNLAKKLQGDNMKDEKTLREVIKAQTAQQKADAEAGRNIFSNWMSNLVTRIKTIFSKDANDGETSYYEMMETEQQRMQEYVAAHTSTVKTNADTTNARLQNIISELQKIQTNDDENANAIKNAINNLDLVVNNNIEYPRN